MNACTVARFGRLPLLAVVLAAVLAWNAPGLGADRVLVSAEPPLTLRVYAANETKPLSGAATETADGARLWKLPDGGECRISPAASGESLDYDVSFSAPAGRTSLYRVEMTATLAAGAGGWRYWNGNRETDLAAGRALERRRFNETFPLAVVTRGEEEGFALGLTPRREFGSFASRAEQRGARLTLAVSSKVVVDAEHPQALQFTARAFRPRFGWRDAVQQYHDRYAEAFRPQPGVDPRIHGNGGYLGLHWDVLGFESHPRRFDLMTWEWSYAPWVMAGNWYPEPEENLEREYQAEGENSNRVWIGRLPRGPDGNIGWATYNRAWKEHFASADRRVAMMYYILVNDIHMTLLDRFPEARLRRADGSIYGGGIPSIASDRGRTAYAFAHGSGLQDYLERKLRLAAENYAISGFALDMTNNAYYNYAPAQLANGRFRTYDAAGKICTGTFANPALFGEYIHTLERDGRRMGVSMNFGVSGITAPAAFAADAAMYEGAPVGDMEMVLAFRLLAGRKPLYFWGAAEAFPGLLDWPRIGSDPELLDRVNKQWAQLQLFYALRYGVAMKTTASSNPVIRPWAEAVIALQRLGWNAAEGIADSSGKLWIGRFGRGADTVFSVTNPERETVAARLALIHKYLGEGTYVPLAESGELSIDAADGESAFDVVLPAKGVLMLAVAELPARFTARLRTRRADGGELFMEADDGAILPEPTLPARDYRGRAHPKAERDGASLVLAPVPAVAVGLGDDWSDIAPDALRNPETRPALRLGAAPSAASRTVADMADFYVPFRLRVRQPTENLAIAAYNWRGIDPAAHRLTRLAPDGEAPAGRWTLLVGQPDELPFIADWLDGETRDLLRLPDQGVVRRFEDRRALWIGGNSPAAILAAGDAFFARLDALPLSKP